MGWKEKLEKHGFSKLIQRVDEREAARAGLYARPLTTANVEKHLIDFGLEAEFGTHNRIKGLSGGQKVKLVLGAAMWQQPHIVVMDEPTNYLDRDALGALACAVKEFGGGVLLITHNCEFADALKEETWAFRVPAKLLSPVTDGVKVKRVRLKRRTGMDRKRIPSMRWVTPSRSRAQRRSCLERISRPRLSLVRSS